MPVPHVVTCENITLSSLSVYGFSLPILRKDVKEWVKGCARCVAHIAWRSPKSDLYFLAPVTTQFYIMHVDIWSPGHLVDTYKDTIQLMNLMCELTQFFISSVLRNINTEILAKTFMEEFAL